MSKDGIIAISIDDHEEDSLKMICDEIFGEGNFIAKCPRKTVEHIRKLTDAEIQVLNDYILIYCKERTSCILNKKETGQKTYEYKDERGKFTLKSLQNSGENGTRRARPNLYYPIYYSKITNDFSLDKRDDSIEILPKKVKGEDGRWLWSQEKFQKDKNMLYFKNNNVLRKVYYNPKEDQRNYQAEKNWLDSYPNRKGSSRLSELGMNATFDYPKPVDLVDFLLSIGDDEDSIILDFFSGSSTTAEAIMIRNIQDNGHRKYIMVQLPEDLDERFNVASNSDKAKIEPAIKFLSSVSLPHRITELGKERIRRAASDLKKRYPDCDCDFGFRVFKVDESNMTNVYYSPNAYNQDMLTQLESNIKPDRTDLDLLFGCLIEWGLPLSMPYTSENIDGCTVHTYQELKKQLDQVDEFRFIFTSPTFIKEKAEKQKREFYIPRLHRENSLYGTEFEIKLRNELTQRAIAKECANWIKAKAKFKSNITGENMGGFMTVDSGDDQTAYAPINGFTTVDIGRERGNNSYNMVQGMEAPFATQYMQLFDTLWNDQNKMQDVTDIVIENITNAYNENSPEFIYFMTLYHVFSEFLEDISEDTLPNEATGFKQSKIWNKLYDFQKDAVLAIINKLEKYNGCILADSVGLGKTFTALAVIKYYENRNKSVLVLCPKKLAENWNTYKDNYVNNPIAADRLNYDVLFHTDLSRNGGFSNGLDLDRLNWGNYDLVVIDESHNFRNGGELSGEDAKENRYLRLLNKVVRAGVKTKVLMLSATPVNNRFNDLKNQLALAYEGDSSLINDKLGTSKSIDEIFRQAQKAFNAWSRLEPEERTTDALLRTLDFDFFEVLDSVTIARSRKHVEKYYNTAEIGKFPERLKPISKRPNLTDLKSTINYNQIYEQLMMLSLCIYTPSNYIFPSKLEKYMDLSHHKGTNLTQHGREQGIQRLMSINLLKRLESSVYSFNLTLERIYELIKDTIRTIDEYDRNGTAMSELDAIDYDLDIDDENSNFLVGKKVKINLDDMDYKTWREELQKDAETLELLILLMKDITPEHDTKLQTLFELLDDKMAHPINEGNKKVLIFSAFSDTAEYLYENVSQYMKEKYGLNTAVITGTIEGKTTIKGFKATLNNVLTCFSPISKGKDLLMPNRTDEIDILIATDCISEGQNLQDCDYLINYDIHWNPVRIIQRFGRIDRIGSRNAYIQLVNFWPDMTLDDYINLKSRVETRMKISIMTSTGDDNLLSPEEKGDLEYRKQQLQRLQEEVVDLEDISSGISIMDLGLNEFRLDLLEYVKTHEDIEKKPTGLHAVVANTPENPQGVIFVLKNINNSVNVDNRNRIHPFYMVYIGSDGEIVCDYLNPKKMLDTIRLLCRDKSEPIVKLCNKFNAETDDGRNMGEISELLNDAILSIIDTKEESDIDSLFSGGGTSALMSNISGLDDFELICFLVVK